MGKEEDSKGAGIMEAEGEELATGKMHRDDENDEAMTWWCKMGDLLIHKETFQKK